MTQAQKRPLSQKELKQLRDEKAPGPEVTLYNPRSQMVTLRFRPTGSDFFKGEQSVQIRGKNLARLSKNYLDWNQIKNLQKRGHLKVLGEAAQVQ